MGLRSDPVAGVRFLAAVHEGRGVKPAARSVGVHPWTGYRWLREAFLAHRCNGLTAVAVRSELGCFTVKALVWEEDRSPAWVMAAHLRSLATSSGRTGVIGCCSGGRPSVLAAGNLDLDAAVDCYGAFVTGTPGKGSRHRLATWCSYRMGLPAAGSVRKRGHPPLPRAGRRAGAGPHRYRPTLGVPPVRQAGHGFFAVDRAMCRGRGSQQRLGTHQRPCGTHLSTPVQG